MSRRALYAITMSAACAVALVVSCGFPDLDFSARDGAEGGSEGGGEGGADGGADTSTIPEAAPPIDGTSEKPDTGPCVDPCDCDKDKHRAKNAGCGGDDCDDTD